MEMGRKYNNKHMNDIQNKEQCDKAIALKGQIEKSYILLSSLLKDIRDNRLYTPQYDKFPEFLMELDMSEGTASKMIQSYERLILEYELPEEQIEKIGWSKSYLVAKNAKTKEEAQELILLAEQQTTRDLDSSLKEKYQGIDQATCEHDWAKFQVCKRCNLKERI